MYQAHKKKGYKIQRLLVLSLFSFLTILIFLPLIWIVVSSLKTNIEFLTDPLGWPSELMFENYLHAWNRGFSTYFFNSILVNVITVILTLILASLCAYGLARFKFRGRDTIFYAILAGLLISPHVAVIPLYRLLISIGLYDTYIGLILPYVGFRLPFAIFLIRSYFLSIPVEIEESAYIDGCNSLTLFIRIIMPISKPIIATAALLTSRFVWNEFVFALIFIESSSKYTIPVGLTHFQDTLTASYGIMLAAIVIAAIPMVLLFLAMQKHFIAGLTAGSVKG